MLHDQITGVAWQVLDGVQIYLTPDGVFEAKVERRVVRNRDVRALMRAINREAPAVQAMMVSQHELQAPQVLNIGAVVKSKGYTPAYRTADGQLVTLSHFAKLYVHDAAALAELRALAEEYTALRIRWQQRTYQLVELTPERFSAMLTAYRQQDAAGDASGTAGTIDK